MIAIVLREIKQVQRSQKVYILKDSFLKLIREMMKNVKIELRIQKIALETLQKTFETLLVSIFESKF